MTCTGAEFLPLPYMAEPFSPFAGSPGPPGPPVTGHPGGAPCESLVECSYRPIHVQCIYLCGVVACLTEKLLTTCTSQ